MRDLSVKDITLLFRVVLFYKIIHYVNKDLQKHKIFILFLVFAVCEFLFFYKSQKCS